MNKHTLQQDTNRETILQLQNQIRRRERGISSRSGASQNEESISTGCPALDRLLPDGGVRAGCLIEWLGDGIASGAGTLSLIAGGNICPAERPLILIDTQQQLFALSLALLGFDLSRVVLIRPPSEQEALWACEEALRCEGVGLVWANLERLTSTHYRRLQLAAEASGGIGFLVRSTRSLGQPSWAEARLRVRPTPVASRAYSHSGFNSNSASPCYRVDVIASHGNSNSLEEDIMIDSIQGTLYGHPPSSHSLSVVS